MLSLACTLCTRTKHIHLKAWQVEQGKNPDKLCVRSHVRWGSSLQERVTFPSEFLFSLLLRRKVAIWLIKSSPILCSIGKAGTSWFFSTWPSSSVWTYWRHRQPYAGEFHSPFEHVRDRQKTVKSVIGITVVYLIVLLFYSLHLNFMSCLFLQQYTIWKHKI